MTHWAPDADPTHNLSINKQIKTKLNGTVCEEQTAGRERDMLVQRKKKPECSPFLECVNLCVRIDCLVVYGPNVIWTISSNAERSRWEKKKSKKKNDTEKKRQTELKCLSISKHNFSMLI